jgi:hypothetical protein
MVLSLPTPRSSTATGNRLRKRYPSYILRYLLLSPKLRSTQEWLKRQRDVGLPFLASFRPPLALWLVSWLIGLFVTLCIEEITVSCLLTLELVVFCSVKGAVYCAERGERASVWKVPSLET